MAIRSEVAARETVRPADARPARRGPIGVIDEREHKERARERQARVLLGLAGIVLAVALVVVAVGHAMLAATQVRADALQSQLSGALATEQNLRLSKATLETPSRILTLAERRFKMTAPPAVTYLEPVAVGPSVLTAHEQHHTPTSHPHPK